MNILIVDNDALSIQLLQRYVGERLGHQTVGVRSIAEADALMECQDFDVVMIDIDLPDNAGVELLEKLRRLMTPMNLPIVAMGDSSSPQKELKVFEMGANEFLHKPLEPRSAVARVRTLLNCRREFLRLKRKANHMEDANSHATIGFEDQTATVSEAEDETVKRAHSVIGGMIPFEVPVMILAKSGSFFCKTLELSMKHVGVLAFAEIPRHSKFKVQMVHPTGETMEVEATEVRRKEVAEGDAGFLQVYFQISSTTILFRRFCQQLDRAYRLQGLKGLTEVMKGSMSISRAASPSQTSATSVRTMEGARYRFEKVLGVGGFAAVFLVRDLALQRLVAMKVLSPELAAEAVAREKFLGEAQIAAQFHHANIVFVYEVGDLQNEDLPRFLDFPTEILSPYKGHFIYFTMQYIEGHSLAEEIKDHHRLNVERTNMIFGEVLRALSFSHRKGVIHRDIKPGNIMIEKDGSIIVTDFGIARLMGDGRDGDGVECTPKYASPEQLLSRKLDGRSDIYSIGITVYEMLNGRPPFSDDRLDVLVARQLNETPASLLDRVPDLSEGLEKIIMKCIAKQPEARYSDVDVILEELENLKPGNETQPQAEKTLDNLVERVMQLKAPEQAPDIMRKLLAHLQLNDEDDDTESRIRARIAEPSVLDTLLNHTLYYKQRNHLYDFFKDLSASRATLTLLRWYHREGSPLNKRTLAQLAVVSSKQNLTPLIHEILEMDDEDGAVMVEALENEDLLHRDVATRLCHHKGEQTRLSILRCIGGHRIVDEIEQKIIRHFAKHSRYESVRQMAIQQMRELVT